MFLLKIINTFASVQVPLSQGATDDVSTDPVPLLDDSLVFEGSPQLPSAALASGNGVPMVSEVSILCLFPISGIYLLSIEVSGNETMYKLIINTIAKSEYQKKLQR